MSLFENLRSKRKIPVLFALPVLCSLGTPLNAHSGPTPFASFGAPGTTGFTLSQSALYSPRSDVKDTDGMKLGFESYETRAAYRINTGEGQFWTFNAAYEYTNYRWTGVDPDPFSGVDRFTLSTVGLHRFDQSNWGLFTYAQASWAAASDASLSSGYNYTLVVGPSYAFSPTFSVVVGVLADKEPERSGRVLPVAALNWRINENLLLRTFNGATLYYDPGADGEWVFDLTAEYQTRRFRLQNQFIALPDVHGDPMLNDRAVVLSGGATWRLNDAVSLRGFVEGRFSRELTMRYDRQRIDKIDLDPGVAFGAQLSINF